MVEAGDAHTWEHTSAAAAAGACRPNCLPRVRLLIAEDDQVLADGLLRSLRSAGYAVDQVGDGGAACANAARPRRC